MINRIDLTQFEGISNDLWDTWILNEQQASEGKTLIVFTMDMQNPVCLIEGYETAEEGMANAKAIAHVPKMIAELRRCYEEIDEVRYMLMKAYDGQKERERQIDYLRSYCLDNGVCPHCGEAQKDPALREHLGLLKMCYPCEDKIYFGIEPKDAASE